MKRSPWLSDSRVRVLPSVPVQRSLGEDMNRDRRINGVVVAGIKCSCAKCRLD